VSGVTAVLDALTAWTADVFAVTDRLAATVRRVVEDGGPLTRARLKPIGGLASDALTGARPLLQGAGFVAAVGELKDARRWLEWFSGDAEGRPQRLVVQTDPHGEYFYDYTQMPWFTVPRDTGRRHVTGPYVDYLCTNDYTVTFTVPVFVAGRFVGVAGCDVGVGAAEKALMPALCSTRHRSAVVNRDGRVLASNSARHVCGELVRSPEVASVWESAPSGLHAVEDLPLAVVELA
jgi:hypothetical protein